MAERGEGMAVPDQRQRQNQQNQQQNQQQQQKQQQQQQNLDPAGQHQHLHLNCQISKQNSQENLMRMQKHIYFIQMIGCMLITLLMV